MLKVGIRKQTVPCSLRAQTWVDATTQVLFSEAVSLGTLIALGSYNKYHNPVYK